MRSAYTNDKFKDFVSLIFDHTVKNLFCLSDYQLRVIKRRKVVNTRGLILGYIDLRKKVIALDIYTPKKREPKSMNSLLRTIAHEIAHIQKPPYAQIYRGRRIVRQHYPQFYKQVEKNLGKIKKDPYLGQYFQ